MKKTLFILTAALVNSLFLGAQNNIATARTNAVGNIVTVNGVVTNGGELGVIRYLQDKTAGIAAYGATLSSVNRGDSISVSGTLKLFNNLLELDPIAGYTVISTNKNIPAPLVITPAQFDETVEGQLIRINNVSFGSAAGGTFPSTATNYTVTSNGQSFAVRSNTFLSGTQIPSANVNLVGLASQFCSSPTSGCTTGYQMLLRTNSDILSITTGVSEKTITNTRIYPNPANQFVKIEDDNIENMKGLKIYNLLGACVLTIEGPVKEFSVGQLPTGIYVVNINQGNHTVTKRLVIER